MGSRVLSALAIAVLASAWGCGGDDSGGEEGGTGGAAGSTTGGTGGSATGGTGGTGTGGTGTGGTGTGGTAGSSTGGAAGSSTGGAAGSSTGGAAGSSTGGAAGTGTGGAAGSGTGGGAAFWTDTYNPNGNPNPTGGKHNAGKDCLSCHKAGGPGPAWLFGGTVYKADKTTPAPHVQIGVKSGTNLYTAYSATNGNFWVPAGPTVTWSAVEIRARNANGEKKMTSAPTSGSCNTCHTGAAVILEP